MVQQHLDGGHIAVDASIFHRCLALATRKPFVEIRAVFNQQLEHSDLTVIRRDHS